MSSIKHLEPRIVRNIKLGAMQQSGSEKSNLVGVHYMNMREERCGLTAFSAATEQELAAQALGPPPVFYRWILLVKSRDLSLPRLLQNQ